VTNTGSSRRKRPNLLIAATILFAIGIVAIAGAFTFSAVGYSAAIPVLLWLALGTPLGLLLAIVYALRSGRRAQTANKGT